MNNYIEEYAENNLSSFEGDVEKQEEYTDVYTGESDDFLDFAGGNNFADEQKAGRTFVMTIKNNGVTTENVVLFPGYAHDASEGMLAKDGVVSSPVVEVIDPMTGLPIPGPNPTSLEFKGLPAPIEDLHGFLKAVPSNLVGFRVASTDVNQLQQVVTFKEKTPFKKTASKELFLSTYVSENSQRNDLISVQTPDIVLGAETQMVIPVVANSTLTLTFFIGGVLSTSSALRQKTRRAIRHISKVGVAQVRGNQCNHPSKPVLSYAKPYNRGIMARYEK